VGSKHYVYCCPNPTKNISKSKKLSREQERRMYYRIPVEVGVALFLASFLPIWRSGLRDSLNFWGWVLNHTVWGPPVEYIPEEDYMNII